MFSLFSKKTNTPSLLPVNSGVPDISDTIAGVALEPLVKSGIWKFGNLMSWWNKTKKELSGEISKMTDLSGSEPVQKKELISLSANASDAIVVSLSQYSFWNCSNSDLKITISLPQLLGQKKDVPPSVPSVPAPSVEESKSDDKIYEMPESEPVPKSEQTSPECETQPVE